MPDVSQGKMTSLIVPKNPVSFVGRMGQAVRYAISGVTPETWFGPMQPLAPMAPDDVKGRAFDYPVGYNLNYTPRGYEHYGFADLRALADNCDLLRTIIENRKDQLSGAEWVIRPKQKEGFDFIEGKNPYKTSKSNIKRSIGVATQDQRERMLLISEFLESPDKELDWNQWQRALLEEQFVIDAPSVYRRRTRGGALYALEIIDGATIKPLLDADGRRPRAPDPAYQQVLKGIPAADFTSDELYYWPKNVRADKVYGFPQVEQVLITINTSIRRSIFQLDYYLAGSQPDAFVGLPKEWTLKNIKEFQDYMDAMLSGKLAERRKLRFVPGEFKYQETKAPPLKDLYDEWLARIICFCFGIAPEPFIDRINRSSAETSSQQAMAQSRDPTQKWVKSCVDKVIRNDFFSPDLEFIYVDDEEQDPAQQVKIDVAQVESGLASINEVRALRGRPTRPGVADELMIKTTVGYVPVGQLANQAQVQNSTAVKPAGEKAPNEKSGVDSSVAPTQAENDDEKQAVEAVTSDSTEQADGPE